MKDTKDRSSRTPGITIGTNEEENGFFVPFVPFVDFVLDWAEP
jgi:hypothetical protein